MRKNRLNNTIFNIILCTLALLITFFLIITGAYFQEGYNIKVGSVSPKKFIATNSIKNEYATQKLIDEAVATVSPLYTHNTEIQKKVITDINSFFKQIDKLIEDLKAKEQEQNPLNTDVPDAYFYQSISPSDSENTNTISSKIYLTQGQIEILKGLSDNEFSEFKKNVIKITNTALEQGIMEDSENKTLLFIKEELSNLNINEKTINIGYAIISAALEPNLIVDEEATQKAKDEKAAEVEPVMVLKNQKIVDEGEIVTEEIYSILDSLGYINKNNIFENIAPITGVFLFVLIIFLTMIFYIYSFNKKLYNNRKEITLLFTLYIIIIISARFLTVLPFTFVPILSFTMLVAMLINAKLAVILNLVVSIACCLIYKGDIEFLLYFIPTGTIMAITTTYTMERSRIIFVGILNAFANTIVIIGITLFFNKEWSNVLLTNIIYAFASSILTLMLSVGSLPFWETFFGIVTTVKLLELTNPNKEILRRLMIEAPGTYHHSLIVANLAEAAAYEIGANSTLARVGGYYHDIGKLKYPQYFSENIVGENLHDYMDPYSSAKVITEHVTAGIELAEGYKLPQVVKDIISQHHGNTLVKFFYYKAKKMYSETAVKEKDFRYNFDIPQSKEAALIMLSDTVEAAVRSMIPTGKTMDEIEVFVKTLIKDKLDDGQLIDSLLTIKDLDTISKSFMGIFKGMYHERIPYPEDKKIPKSTSKEAVDKNQEDKKDTDDKGKK